MTDHFLALSCPGCSSKLDIYDDMERFACGYCGKEMIVQRRGGTVRLSGIVDKMAAELALVRLEKEWRTLHAERQSILSGSESAGSLRSFMLAGISIISSLLSLLFALAAGISVYRGGSGVYALDLYLALIFGFFGWCFFMWKRTVAANRLEGERQRDRVVAELDSKIAQTEKQIAVNLQIVENSVSQPRSLSDSGMQFHSSL